MNSQDLANSLSSLQKIEESIENEAPKLKQIRCNYPMPNWTGGICNCHHFTEDHEKLIKSIESQNKMPFDTTPNQSKLVYKMNPWKGVEEYYCEPNV